MRLTGPALTLLGGAGTVATTARTTALALRTLPGELRHDLRVTTTGWAVLGGGELGDALVAAGLPVTEALHGCPGSPQTWLRRLAVQSHLDQEIAAGRPAPAVVLFSWQTPRRLLGTECTDPRNGPQTGTFVTVDVPAHARAHLRVRDSGRGLIGYPAGAFCAINLALRHPARYPAAAVVSGYASLGITIGDGSEKTTNNPGWRLRHLPRPAIALWPGRAGDDRQSARDSQRMATMREAPLSVTTAVVAHGGHSDAVWIRMEPPAFDRLSARLPRPAPLS
ncbi:hypothetical protein GCM10010172_81780 [Paractinoplanes ferrugineus]|uniref:Uncharacterized protein n=1 Tax=Paractinoplanes ferrugineus TaxID=113564 RepID=A0A919IYI1_9ACTN|nr:alpha/beta hydrolase-fold protein [Actinoplanes ferrugineus]GIE10499.1 hypothetical protein Afe05nite_23390 [Actinoplanes ferrugineus]